MTPSESERPVPGIEFPEQRPHRLQADTDLIFEAAGKAGCRTLDSPENFLAAHDLIKEGKLQEAINLLVWQPTTEFYEAMVTTLDARAEELHARRKEHQTVDGVYMKVPRSADGITFKHESARSKIEKARRQRFGHGFFRRRGH